MAQLDQMQAAGKGDFVRKVHGLYLEHAPIAMTRLRDAATAGDAEACAQAAHALKSMSYNVGAARVAALAQEIETAAKLGQRCPGQQAITKLSEAIHETLDAIEWSEPFEADVQASNVIALSSVGPASSTAVTSCWRSPPATAAFRHMRGTSITKPLDPRCRYEWSRLS